MAVQPQEPEGPLVLLENHHLKGMPPEMKRALVLLASGLTREAIAAQMGVSPATIKRWVETATAEMLVCLDGEHDNKGELRGFWAGRHLECCLGIDTGAAA
jgi:DNA-directed RNA polymerase specialized sigma24 family protein